VGVMRTLSFRPTLRDNLASGCLAIWTSHLAYIAPPRILLARNGGTRKGTTWNFPLRSGGQIGLDA